MTQDPPYTFLIAFYGVLLVGAGMCLRLGWMLMVWMGS